MRKIQLFGLALSALLLLTVSTVSAFDFTLTTAPVDQAAHMIYDPGTGDVSFFSPGDAITSMQIEGPGGSFNGWTWTKENFFDVQTAVKQAKFNFDGFASDEAFALGPIMAMGLTGEEIVASIKTDGSRLAGGKINTSPGGGPYLLVVPEPSSIALVFCGLLGLLGLRRK